MGSSSIIPALTRRPWWASRKSCAKDIRTRRSSIPRTITTTRRACRERGAGCAAGLACHLFTTPTYYADPRAFQGGFRWFALISLVVLSAYLCIHLRASLVRARFLLLLLCFVFLGIVVLRASPRPWIDVWVFQQGGADALLHG